MGQYASTMPPQAVQFGAENTFVVVPNLFDPFAATAAYVEQAGRRAGQNLRLRVLEARPPSIKHGKDPLPPTTNHRHYRVLLKLRSPDDAVIMGVNPGGITHECLYGAFGSCPGGNSRS